MGKAWVTTPSWVTLRETPPSVEERGNDKPGLWAGPRFSPNAVKMPPRAMGPLGKPAGARDAALTAPRLVRMGCCAQTTPTQRSTPTMRIGAVYHAPGAPGLAFHQHIPVHCVV